MSIPYKTQYWVGDNLYHYSGRSRYGMFVLQLDHTASKNKAALTELLWNFHTKTLYTMTGFVIETSVDVVEDGTVLAEESSPKPTSQVSAGKAVATTTTTAATTAATTTAPRAAADSTLSLVSPTDTIPPAYDEDGDWDCEGDGEGDGEDDEIIDYSPALVDSGPDSAYDTEEYEDIEEWEPELDQIDDIVDLVLDRLGEMAKERQSRGHLTADIYDVLEAIIQLTETD